MSEIYSNAKVTLTDAELVWMLNEGRYQELRDMGLYDSANRAAVKSSQLPDTERRKFSRAVDSIPSYGTPNISISTSGISKGGYRCESDYVTYSFYEMDGNRITNNFIASEMFETKAEAISWFTNNYPGVRAAMKW